MPLTFHVEKSTERVSPAGRHVWHPPDGTHRRAPPKPAAGWLGQDAPLTMGARGGPCARHCFFLQKAGSTPLAVECWLFRKKQQPPCREPPTDRHDRKRHRRDIPARQGQAGRLALQSRELIAGLRPPSKTDEAALSGRLSFMLWKGTCFCGVMSHATG